LAVNVKKKKLNGSMSSQSNEALSFIAAMGISGVNAKAVQELRDALSEKIVPTTSGVLVATHRIVERFAV
jgi:hypothetical protein